MNSDQGLPLLGCLHDIKILSASTDRLVVDGPLFTANKVNRNGWGISTEEAVAFAESLKGKPLRYCPAGQPMPGVPAEHACDARDDRKSIIGTIDHVYPAGFDEKGRQIYNQRATITASHVIQGLRDGLIKPFWSLFGKGRRLLENRMIEGATGEAGTIVSEPAYNEAVFKLAASTGILPLYKHQSTGGSKKGSGDSTMTEGQNQNNSQPPAGATPPGNQQQAGGQDPAKQYAAEIEKLKAENKTLADKLAAQDKIEAEKKAKEQAPPSQQPTQTSLTPDEVKKMIETARAEERDLIQRTTLAQDVAAIKVSAGLLKAEDVKKATEELVTLSASVLEKQKLEYTEVAKRLGKPVEKPFSASFVPLNQGSAAGMPEGAEQFLMEKFHQTPEDIKKYAGQNTRSVLNIGRKP